MSEQNMCQLLAAARADSILFSRLLRTALNVLCLKKSTPSFSQSPRRHRRHLRVTVFFTRSILYLYIIVVPKRISICWSIYHRKDLSRNKTVHFLVECLLPQLGIRSRHSIGIAGRVYIFRHVSDMHRLSIEEAVWSKCIDFLQKEELIHDVCSLLWPKTILSTDERCFEHRFGHRHDRVIGHFKNVMGFSLIQNWVDTRWSNVWYIRFRRKV